MGGGEARDGSRVCEGLGRIIPQVAARAAKGPDYATGCGSTCRAAAIGGVDAPKMFDVAMEGGTIQPGSGASAVGSRSLAGNEQE